MKIVTARNELIIDEKDIAHLRACEEGDKIDHTTDSVFDAISSWCDSVNGLANEGFVDPMDILYAVNAVEDFRKMLRLGKSTVDGVDFIQDPHGNEFTEDKEHNHNSTILVIRRDGRHFAIRGRRNSTLFDNNVRFTPEGFARVFKSLKRGLISSMRTE